MNNLELASRDTVRRQQILGGIAACISYVCILAGNFTFPLFGVKLEVRFFLVVIALFFWAIWRATNARLCIASKPSSYNWILWGGLSFLFISALFGPSLATSVELLAGFVIIGCNVSIIVTVLNTYPQFIRSVFPVLIGIGYLYALAAIASGPGLQGRYSAFGGGPNVFGRIVGFALVALLVHVTIQRKYWLLLTLPLPVMVLILSGSRGAMLSAAVAAAAVSILLLRSYRFPQLVAILIMLVCVITLMVEFTPPSVAQIFNQRIIEQTLGQGYDSGRSELYDVAREMFESNPILGVGVGGYFALFGSSTASGVEYAHNIVLQVLAETGLIGFIFILLPVALILLRAAIRRPQSVESVGALGLTLVILVSSMFSGGYYDFRYAWLFLGILYVCQGIESKGDSSPYLCYQKRSVLPSRRTKVVRPNVRF